MSKPLAEQYDRICQQEAGLRLGGGLPAIDRQHAKGRLTARERIARLLDPEEEFLELNLWAAWDMYNDWGGAPGAGVITGIGRVSNRQFMIIANDATVKAGAFFPQTCKKFLRAQRIAMDNRLPLIYLVDSAGAFLPLQDEVFPDEDDFGRIFRNNAVISASGLPQFAAIMGNCVAGGGYLPVMCDKLLMTEGSGLYLAGPSLVQAAIGQKVSTEELGGAKMHSEISGTIDFREKDDDACIRRLRKLAELIPEDRLGKTFHIDETMPPAVDMDQALSTFDPTGRAEYDLRDVLAGIVDAGTWEEYKADYGQSLVTVYAKIGGIPVGIVGNQRKRVKPAKGPLQFGAVIYVDSAEKAARFILDCNQFSMPIIFFQDVNGFMVGRDSEQEGIIRSGAKLVNVVSNSIVPKITVITGGSFGAGNYALCGKAYDPRFIYAWPCARYAVMGGEQAADTLFQVYMRNLKDGADTEEIQALRDQVAATYQRKLDMRYGAARGWVDAIIDPWHTRETLIRSLAVAIRSDVDGPMKTGVWQV
jgi:acetyl-CoA carboxylase carboxyltransferase component